MNSVKSIDYAIDSVYEQNDKVNIILRRKGLMPMPIDVEITSKNGDTRMINIPLNLMFGAKQNEWPSKKYSVLPAWDWVRPLYLVQLEGSLKDIRSIVIDPGKRMADVNRRDNSRTNLR